MSGLTVPFFSICHRERKCWCTIVLKYRSMRKIQKKIPGVWTHANQYATTCKITQPMLSEPEVSLLQSVCLTSWYSKTAHCCLKIAYDWNAKIQCNTPPAPAKLLTAPKPDSTWFHPAMWGREQRKNRLGLFLITEYDAMLLPCLNKSCRKQI